MWHAGGAARGFMCLLVLIGLGALTAAQVLPSFTAISIRPYRARLGAQPTYTVDPVRLHAVGLSFRTLTKIAYGVEDFQLSGGEPWTRTELSTLDATTVQSTATDQMLFLMLQAGLESRFGLELAHEKRLMPVLALVVAKGGPHLRVLGPNEQPRIPILPAGTGHVNIGVGGDSIGSLVSMLNDAAARRSSGRIVVDHTGLTKRYDLWLTAGATPATIFGRRAYHVEFSEMPQDSMQFGLAQTKSQAPIDYYAIRSAHPPTPN